MRKYIEVKLEIEGLHHWPDCNLPHVEYLKHLHRHTFVINCRAEVSHGDRDIEFIDFKHKVKQYVALTWYDPAYGCCNFGAMSCTCSSSAASLPQLLGAGSVLRAWRASC